MKRLLCIIVVLLSFIVLLVACKENPNSKSSQSSSSSPAQEGNLQQAIYNLCKEKGGVPIVINDEVTDCIFKENRTNSWE